MRCDKGVFTRRRHVGGGRIYGQNFLYFFFFSRYYVFIRRSVRSDTVGRGRHCQTTATTTNTGAHASPSLPPRWPHARTHAPFRNLCARIYYNNARARVCTGRPTEGQRNVPVFFFFLLYRGGGANAPSSARVHVRLLGDPTARNRGSHANVRRSAAGRRTNMKFKKDKYGRFTSNRNF